MIKSMTGYGRAEENFNGCTITVELRSVNNRYLDCNVRIPRLYLFAEDAIKTRVQGIISRGKVDVFVTMDSAGAEKVQVSVNKPVADGYYAALKQLSKDYGLSGEISVSLLSRFPEVLLAEKAEEEAPAGPEPLGEEDVPKPEVPEDDPFEDIFKIFNKRD